MHEVQTRKRLAVIVGLAFAAAACAGTTAETASDDVDAASDDLVAVESPTTTAAPTETSEPAPPVETSPVSIPDQWLGDVVADTPSARGWIVDAGTWASDAFDPAIAFDLPSGLTLTHQAPWSFQLGLDGAGSTAMAHVVRSSTLTLSTDVSVPIPKTIDEITEFIESSDGSTMLDHGRFDRADAEVGWWEIVINEELVGEPCSIGENCVQIARSTGGDPVFFVPGEPFVVVSLIGEDNRYAAYVTGPPEERAELFAAMDTLFTSLVPLPEEAESPDYAARFVSSIANSPSSVAAGSYHQFMNGVHVQFRLEEPVDDLALVAGETEMLILAAPVGDIAIIAYGNMVVDPSIAQAGLDRDAAVAIARLPDPPASIDQWAAYADELGELTATGTSNIGGIEVPWFEFSVEPGSGYPCGPNYVAPASECIEFLSRWSHSEAEATNRHFIFAEEQIMVIAYAAPEHTIDQVLTAFQPLLDGLSVSTAG